MPALKAYKFLTLAIVTGLAGACATSSGSSSGPKAASEPAMPSTTEPPKVAPVLVEYQSKLADAPLSRIGVLVDGKTIFGKAGPLGAGEHKISILVELTPADSKPLAYQREYVVRLGEARYLKALVAINAAPLKPADDSCVDIQVHVMEDEKVPVYSGATALQGEKWILQTRQPLIDERLIVEGLRLNNLVQVCVDTQGKVESETLLSPSNTLYDAAVLRGLSNWVFRPMVEMGNAKAFCYPQRNVLKVER